MQGKHKEIYIPPFYQMWKQLEILNNSHNSTSSFNKIFYFKLSPQNFLKCTFDFKLMKHKIDSDCYF